MIIEPNPFHGEVIPGVIHYFNLLGYKIKLFVRNELIKEKLIPNVFFDGEISTFNTKDVKQIFDTDNINEYDFIFFTSLEYQNEEDLLVDFVTYNDLDIHTKYGILGIYHSINFLNIFGTRSLAEEGRVFCLSEFQRIMPSINVLNPHYFKDLNYVEENMLREPKDIVKIAMLGNMFKSDIVAKAVKKLSKKEKGKIRFFHTGGQKRKGFKKNIKKKFKLIIYYLLSKINDRWEGRVFEDKVIEMGRLDFPDLFDFLGKIDYLLMPLDHHTYEGMHYISVSTSGTKQISLGMGIPVICNETIGKQYGFDSDNAILYTENQLEDALRKVLEIKANECNRIKSNLQETADKIAKESLDNLKRTIEKLTK